MPPEEQEAPVWVTDHACRLIGDADDVVLVAAAARLLHIGQNQPDPGLSYSTRSPCTFQGTA
jgi:hypothetical protein